MFVVPRQVTKVALAKTWQDLGILTGAASPKHEACASVLIISTNNISSLAYTRITQS
jgi:hypothetical protein